MLMIEKNLAIARKNKGITQIELAEMLHVSNGTVGNWESGKRTPDIESVAKIASILDVTTDFLLIDKENIANRTTNNSFELSEKEMKSLRIFNQFFGEGVNSILYDNLRTKNGLVYDVITRVVHENYIKLYKITFTTSKENVDETLDILKKCLSVRLVSYLQ